MADSHDCATSLTGTAGDSASTAAYATGSHSGTSDLVALLYDAFLSRVHLQISGTIDFLRNPHLLPQRMDNRGRRYNRDLARAEPLLKIGKFSPTLTRLLEDETPCRVLAA